MAKSKTNKIVLKYPTPISPTSEFDELIKAGVKSYDGSVNLVELSKYNSDIIEKLINEDDRYRFCFSKRVFDSFKSNGKFTRTDDAYFGVLRMIDIDNSTQVWRSDRTDFYKIHDYITSDETTFYDRLKNGDIRLVDDILSKCEKRPISFCSKVCKYLNNWLFEKDDYYIYDYYVLNILPYYLEFYKKNQNNNYTKVFPSDPDLSSTLTYSDYYDVLEKIQSLRDKEFNDTIEKDQLDHIMWYSYRSYGQKYSKIDFPKLYKG